MERAQFDTYAAAFGRRDYDTILSFWAPEFEVYMGDSLLFAGADQLRRTYAFLHAYVEETIHIDRFLSDERSLFMEARVRIAAQRSMTPEVIAQSGIANLVPIAAGTTLDLPQIIHYHLEGGKFTRAVCMLSGPPVVLSA